MRQGWLQSIAVVVAAFGCSGGGFSGAPDAEGGGGGTPASAGKASKGGASGASAEGAQGSEVSAAGAGVAGASSGECDTIYVSPMGDDGSDGCSPDAPKLTLGSALSAAIESAGAQRSVKACAGTYSEAELVLDQPVTLLGGFDCETFKRDTQFGFDKDLASELQSVIEDTDAELGAATLTISGEDVVSDAVVEGFTILGAVNASVATWAPSKNASSSFTRRSASLLADASGRGGRSPSADGDRARHGHPRAACRSADVASVRRGHVQAAVPNEISTGHLEALRRAASAGFAR